MTSTARSIWTFGVCQLLGLLYLAPVANSAAWAEEATLSRQVAVSVESLIEERTTDPADQRSDYSTVEDAQPTTTKVAVEIVGESVEDPTWNYVIVHGMGGTKNGDRFHQLAETIRGVCESVNRKNA